MILEKKLKSPKEEKGEYGKSWREEIVEFGKQTIHIYPGRNGVVRERNKTAEWRKKRVRKTTKELNAGKSGKQ